MCIRDSGVHGRPDIMGHIGEKTAFSRIRTFRSLSGIFLSQQDPAGGITVDHKKCSHDRGTCKDQKKKQQGILDNAVCLLHDDPVGDDGDHVPVRTLFHGDIAEYIVLLLVPEPGSAPSAVFQGSLERINFPGIIALQVDDVKKVLEGRCV